MTVHEIDTPHFDDFDRVELTFDGVTKRAWHSGNGPGAIVGQPILAARDENITLLVLS